MGSVTRLLHLETEPAVIERTSAVLQQTDEMFQIETAATVRAGLEKLSTAEFACVICGPKLGGSDFFETVSECWPAVPVILFPAAGGASGVPADGFDGDGDRYSLLATRVEIAVSQFRDGKQRKKERQQFEALHEATGTLLAAETEDEVAELVGKTVREVIGLPLASVHLYRSEADGLAPVAVTPELRELVGEPPVIGPDDGMAWTAYETGEAKLHRASQEESAVLGAESAIRTEHILPLGTYGVLIVALTTGELSHSEMVRMIGDSAERALEQVERERRMATQQATLKRQNDLFVKTQEIAAVGGWEWNPQTETGHYSDQVWKIYGREISPNRDPELDIQEFYHPDDRETVRTAVQRAIEHGEPYDLEVRITAADGTDKWIRTQADPLVKSGTCIRVRGTIQDITERKQRERELERYEAFIEHTPDSIVVLDADGTVQYQSSISSAADGRLRTVEDENPIEYIHPADRERTLENFQQLLEKPDTVRKIEYRASDADGNWRWFEDRAQNYVGTEPIDGVLVAIRDITDRKEKEAQLRRQNERLDAFASIVSHDLRNPLNIAMGRAELLKQTCDSPHLSEIAWAHDRMATLIDDLLTLARQGEQVDEREVVSLDSLCQRCWHTVETDDATLTVNTDQAIRADKSRLKQVFENLFRNAIEHAGPEVTVTVGDIEDGFYLEDDGPGIPADSREECFEAGYSTSSQGTGFGLSITKQVMTAHGWDISLTEGTDGGARFEVTGVECVDSRPGSENGR